MSYTLITPEVLTVVFPRVIVFASDIVIVGESDAIFDVRLGTYDVSLIDCKFLSDATFSAK